MNEEQPVLRELTRNADDGIQYITEWRCPPPLPGQSYQVLDEEWSSGEPPVRTIRSVRLLGVFEQATDLVTPTENRTEHP